LNISNLYNKYGIYNYLSIVRFNISLLVFLSACLGFFLSNSQLTIKSTIMLTTVLLHSFGCSILNQYSEIIFDSKMGRTKNRPLVTGYFDIKKAFWIGIFFIITSIFIPLFCGKYSVALIYLINFFIYNIIYTKLKRKTSFALIIGSISGALPPIIGWLIGEYTINKDILPISGVFYLWQVPHFLFLTESYKDDYINAGFKILINEIDSYVYSFMKRIWLLAYFMGLIYVLIFKNGLKLSNLIFVFIEILLFSVLFCKKDKSDINFILLNISIIIFIIDLIYNLYQLQL